jgi:hypothetical protein
MTPPWCPRIGRQIAADRAGAFRGEQQRIEPVGIRRRFAHASERHAGFRGDAIRGRVDLADPVEPVEREHDFAVVRDLSADQAGIAALRYDRGPVSLASRSTADTSATEPGRSTIGVCA